MSAEPFQDAFDFGRLHRVTDGARAVYRKLADAVDSVGMLTAAGACGIDRGDLRRGLDRDGRRIAVEHAMAIAAISGTDFCNSIAHAFISPLGLKAVAHEPMGDKEARIRLETMLERHGALGLALREEAYGSRR